MDFQELLSGLAAEHRRLERERSELSEEVSRLRRELRSSQRREQRSSQRREQRSSLGEPTRTQDELPGQVPARDSHRSESAPQRHLSAAGLDWHRDKEHLSWVRRKARFLEIFGLGVSQQHSHTITAENLKEVLTKRGLRNPKDAFLDKAIQELARVSPHRPSQSSILPTGRLFRGGTLSSILPIGSSHVKGWPIAECPNIGFEAFVAAILLPDLPKLVEPSLSPGIEKMQEALLKQDVDEVIAKLSRKRTAMTEDMDPDKTRTSRIEGALNVVVALTVLVSISCLGISIETDPGWAGWVVLEIAFAVIFVTDSVLRIRIFGSREFWCGPDRYFNWLDIIISVITVGDVCLTLVVQEAEDLDFGKLALVMRTFRMMRLGRLLKVMRSPFIRELSNMLLGFVLGSPALFWVSIILWVVVALLAIGLRIAIGPAPGEDVLVEKCGSGDGPLVMVDTDPDCEKHVLFAEEYCGSLSKCMFTVFRCMIGDCTSSGGHSLAAHLSAGYGARFDFVYLTGMIVMIFGIFNVITAIFVEATMVGLKYNETKQKLRRVYEHQYVNRKLRELVRRIQRVSQYVRQGKRTEDDYIEKMTGARNLLNTSISLFRGTPQDTSEDLSEDPDSVANISLTEDEFFAVIEDDVVQRILQQLDIEVDGASKDTLFEIMDSDYNGTVDIAEMIDMLMKLRGGPVKVDMIAPSVAIRGMQQELRRLGPGLASLAVADPADGGASPKARPVGPPPAVGSPMVASRMEWFKAEEIKEDEPIELVPP